MTPTQRLARIIGVLLAALALAACSAIKLGYAALDDVSYWWLNGYFDFPGAQSPKVKDDLARLHAWHRAQELPKVAELLHKAELLAPGSITPAQACAFVPEAQARLMALVEHAEPAAAEAALTMTPAQLRQLQRKSGENNRKWRKEWIEVPASEVHDKRFKQFADRLEMVYGSLDAAQRAVLRTAIERSVFDASRVQVERVRRQQDLQQVLRRLAGQPVPVAEARAALRGYVLRSLESPEPGYRAYQRALLDEGCRLVAAVHEAASPAQRENAVKRLRGYQRDLRDLAASPG